MYDDWISAEEREKKILEELQLEHDWQKIEYYVGNEKVEETFEVCLRCEKTKQEAFFSPCIPKKIQE